MRIASADGSHYAILAETPEGVSVSVWQLPLGGGARRVGAWELDCSFHIARDQVHAIVYPLSKADLPSRHPKDYRR